MIRTSLRLCVTTSLLSVSTIVDVWPYWRMLGNGAKAPEAEVPRNDGFHRITKRSNPAIDAIDETSCPQDLAVPACPAYRDDKAGGVASLPARGAPAPGVVSLHPGSRR